MENVHTSHQPGTSDFLEKDISKTHSDPPRNLDLLEFLSDENKISDFLAKLERTENKISNMKELIKEQENENDEVIEEGRKMLSTLDSNLRKTQEKFFMKKEDIIDEEIRDQCEKKTLESFTMNEILLAENQKLKEMLSDKAKNYNTLLQEYQALQLKVLSSHQMIARLQEAVSEKDQKIEELQKALDNFLSNPVRSPNPSTDIKNDQNEVISTPIEKREELISQTSHQEQNINFIENGIVEQIPPLQPNKYPLNEEKELKKMELDESLWLVAKEKEINFELILDRSAVVKKLPPIVSKSQQLYIRQQKNRQKNQIDRNKNRESMPSAPVKPKSLAFTRPDPTKTQKDNKILPTDIANEKTKGKEYSSPQQPINNNNNNKHDETAEVLKLFNSPHSIKSFESKKKIDPEPGILPANISNISIFSQKEKGEKSNPPFFNSKASFTKIKGLPVHESPHKDDNIFNYKN